ncbi:Uncharacterised protein [Mycobacterium tuberculosis]|nr:Uncharacterised protein [Mycobacterium tuberculosis]
MLCSYLTAATVVMAEPAVAAVTVGPVGLAVTHLRVGRAARVLTGTVVPAGLVGRPVTGAAVAAATWLSRMVTVGPAAMVVTQAPVGRVAPAAPAPPRV